LQPIETSQEVHMRKHLILAFLALALVAGTATMIVIHPLPAAADPSSGGGG
jgi:hypothetical protein